MTLSKIFQSKAFQVVTWVVAGLIVLLVIFWLGMFVGRNRAMFSYRWGENYHRNFGGPREGFLGGFFSDRTDFIESHGVFGQIIKIDGSTLVVKGGDNVEKIILTKDDTSVMRFQTRVKLSDLKVDDYIVVVGQPNESGQIEAKLIRVMPPPLGSAPPQPLGRRFR